MGEVYAAEDTRLHRRVAIKILTGLMAADGERRQRFEREAQAIAALNHPNIVTIHSVEEAGGVPFIVMELVEGRPLSELITAGGLPLDALLRIGVAVSDAIGVAHQRGITHRDLKPANVMIGADGRVKVLDFGLAKLREAEAEFDGETRLPTDELTGEGRIIGTVAYMSPEQAEGKPVDPRSDIFSMGVMLHEMAVGQRPFQGDTNVSIISAILKDTPGSVTDLNPGLPAGLAKVIRRSLSKDPSRRYQTAIDLRNELEDLKQDVDSGVMAAAARTPAPRPSRLAAYVAGGLLLAGALAAAGSYGRPRLASAAPDFVADRFTRITTSGVAQLAAISDDGRYVVHSKAEGLVQSLWVRQTVAASDVQIVPPALVRYDGLAFSPDGNYVFYVVYESAAKDGVASLYRVPVLGGTPARVLEDIDSRVSFSHDGTRFAFIRGYPGGRNYVMTANADGSDVKRLGAAEGETQVWLNAPAWSPDGRTIIAPARSLEGGPHELCLAFDAGSGRSVAVGGRWAEVTDTVWMPDGRSFLVVAADFAGGQGHQIWQVSYPDGERRRITVDLNDYFSVTVSRDGKGIATVQNQIDSSVWVAPAADVSRATPVSAGRGRGDGLQGLAWAGDGRLLFVSSASGSPQVWITDADGAHATPLTTVQGEATGPSAPASGEFAAFERFSEAGIHVYRVGLDGRDPRPLTDGQGEFRPLASADGKWVYFNAFSAGPVKVGRVPSGGGQPEWLETTGVTALGISPDGATLVGTAWNETVRRSNLALLPVAGGAPRLIDLPVLRAPAFSPDGKRVTFIAASNGQTALMSHDLSSGKTTPIHTFAGERLFGFAWSHDGGKVALARGTVSSDVVIISRK